MAKEKKFMTMDGNAAAAWMVTQLRRMWLTCSPR